jgi:signal transduction histidine kinase
MTRTSALKIGVSAVGLSVGIGIGVAALDVLRLRETERPEGGTAAIATMQTAFARLNAAADIAGGASLTELLPEFRRALGAMIAEQSRGGALSPSEIERLNALAGALDSRFADFGAAAMGDPSALSRIAAALAEQGRALDALAAEARAREAAAQAARDQALAAAAARALWIAGGAAALLGLLFAAMALGGGDREAGRAAALDLAETRAALAEAQQGRARFVAMMSHELRTPMNGVLGLIALMKESRPTPSMLRLLDQAERAGLQITGMLGDILEIECNDTAPRRAAETEPEEQEAPKAFRLETLAGAMRDLFGPVAARNRVAFEVDVRGAPPDRAAGDGRRLQRALSHLVSHVIDKAGVKDVSLKLDHTGSECRAELEFTPPPGGAEAVGLDEISDSGAGADAPLGGHGLGPLLAKGLLESMGGRLEVSTLDSGRVLVLAATPSEPIVDPRPRVRVIAQSRSLGALGSAAAAAAGVDVLSLDQAPDPDIVLVEAGGVEEERAVADARTRWPNARVMALGDPDDAALFDEVIPPPLAPTLVSKAVAESWARHQGEIIAAEGDASTPQSFAVHGT